MVVSSCDGTATILPQPPPPPPPAAVPTIRVLLTTTPVESAALEPRRGYRLLADGETITLSRDAGPRLVVTRSGPSWRVNDLDVRGRVLVLESPQGGYSKLGDTQYRGALWLHPQGAAQFVVVNHVDIESYLGGVLAKELYAYWSLETYRALAVAARTFALYHKEHFGLTHDYDLGDNQASQMYGGLTGESDMSRRAVEGTRGVVLTYGKPGREQLFMAQYSACNGGTVNGAYVIREAERIPPLEGGQADNDGQGCKHWRWDPVRISKADVFRAVRASGYPQAAGLANVKEIRVAKETPYGRMVWLDVLDSAGKAIRLRAEDLRLVLLRSGPPAAKALYSMNCRIREVPPPPGPAARGASAGGASAGAPTGGASGGAFEFYDGKGFGHGVGLSQWGAEDKALRGLNARQILEFYYPGATLIRKY
jgi:stage II sporulation protein D